VKGMSVSEWLCPACIEEGRDVPAQKNVTYSDIACSGIPICKECGEDMSFVSEKWLTKVE